MRLARLLIAFCALVAMTSPAAASAAPVDPPGEVSARIIGGAPVTDPTAWPAYVRLSIRESDGDYLCGGTLIQATIVLTAAHCVSGAITAGSTATIGPIDYDTGTEITWSSYLVNPHYNAATSENDVALIRLASPSTATPMPLISPLQDALITSPLTLQAAGFGSTSTSGSVVLPDALQAVDMPFVTNTVCATYYTGPSYRFVSTSMLCAGAPAPTTKDSCKGDSGGPLTFTPLAGVRTLVGNVSWGAFPCNGTAPGVYGRISAFRPWIAVALANPAISRVTNTGGTVNVEWAHGDPSPAWETVNYILQSGSVTTALDPAATTASFITSTAGPLTVTVAATSGDEKTSASWTGTPTPTRPPVLTATVTGKRQVGALLRATPTVDDPWATVTYRWLADGDVIPTATSPSYRLTRDDMGKRITVSIAAVHDAFVGTTAASTARIAGAPRPASRVVPIRGEALVGERVSVRAPAASGYPQPRPRFQWLRNRAPVRGATRASYIVRTEDAGQRLACRITYATRAGRSVVISRTLPVP